MSVYTVTMPTQTKDDCGGKLLSAGEFARRLNICFSTLRNWRISNPPKVRAVPLPGGHYRYPESEIERLQKQKAPASDDSGEDAGALKHVTQGGEK